MTVAATTVSSASKYRATVAASTIYLGSEVLRMAAGFVTMPILTRALTREDYGLLNLSFATVGILALIGRLGFAEATTRFYFEYKQRGPRPLREFCGTMLAGAFATSTLVMVATLVALQWLTSDPSKRRCLQIATSILVVRAVLGVIYQIYRAEERPIANSIAQVATRYVSLVIVVALVFAGRASAFAVLVATLAGETVVAIVGVAEIARRGELGRPRVSRSHLDAAFAYGAPLAFGLYASFFLDYGDRFLVERYLGLGAVATYAVPYDLASTLAAAICGSLKLAVMPVIFRLWESEGERATSEFVSRLLSYAIAIAIPAVGLYVVLSDDLIVFLASDKYSHGGQLSAYLVPGVVMGELNFLLAAGLLICRRTTLLAAISIASCILNLLLNVVLLPRVGLAGAAWATTIAYATLTLATYAAARSALNLRLQPTLIATAVLTTIIMLGLLSVLGQPSAHLLINLMFRAAVGAAVATLGMSLLSAEIRAQTWCRLRDQLARVR